MSNVTLANTTVTIVKPQGNTDGTDKTLLTAVIANLQDDSDMSLAEVLQGLGKPEMDTRNRYRLVIDTPTVAASLPTDQCIVTVNTCTNDPSFVGTQWVIVKRPYHDTMFGVLEINLLPLN